MDADVPSICAVLQALGCFVRCREVRSREGCGVCAESERRADTGSRCGEDMGLGCSSARFAVGWFSRSECIWRTWLLQPLCGCVRADSEELTSHVSEAFMFVCLTVSLCLSQFDLGLCLPFGAVSLTEWA